MSNAFETCTCKSRCGNASFRHVQVKSRGPPIQVTNNLDPSRVTSALSSSSTSSPVCKSASEKILYGSWLRRSTMPVDEETCLANVEVHELVGLVGHPCAEMFSHKHVPEPAAHGRVFVKLLLDVLRNLAEGAALILEERDHAFLRDLNGELRLGSHHVHDVELWLRQLRLVFRSLTALAGLLLLRHGWAEARGRQLSDAAWPHLPHARQSPPEY
mmetsp:Transcript_36498/g.113507  ORF Transcript_36498/g.113507 Transcript_36498/m.113507 type:complete len:215 (+) Transcript_36498:16-660(+)